MLKGLPASGKTTYAKELQKKEPDQWKRVNKDELRAMLDDSVWSKENENLILEIRDWLTVKGLASGKSVIIDDTNLNPMHEAHLRGLAQGYDFQIKSFDTPVEECIERDSQRKNKVGKDVIRRMYNQYLKPPYVQPVYNTALPPAIICDIDGTLAHMNNRGPFDWKKVNNDILDKNIRDILQTYAQDREQTPSIILVSGRDAVCMKETVYWLEYNKVPFDALYMRPEGNNEDDRIIKEAIYNQKIKDKYNILFVLDDRFKVCQMWHNLGLTVLRVGNPADIF